MAEPFSYSVWLVPAQPLRDALTRVIGELAQRFGTPEFTPHATLCSGKWEASVEVLKQQVDALSSSLEPMSLATLGIDCGGTRTTFFYLKLDNDQAAPVFTQAKRALPGFLTPEIGAHLSLMYAEPDTGIDRNALANELSNRMPKQIDFDQLQLVRPVDKGTNTEHWQVLHVVRLDAASG
ncbi:MAG TPA: hypothetical protein VE421_11020 [Burkholderiaceae bacterium]|nr:hypothetical protein [Burkholderiaceae bacterium]